MLNWFKNLVLKFCLCFFWGGGVVWVVFVGFFCFWFVCFFGVFLVLFCFLVFLTKMEKILTTLRNKQNLNLRHGLAPNIKSKTRQVNKIVFRKRKRVNVVPNALFLRDNLFIVYFVSRLFKETELVHVPVHSLSLGSV